MRGVWRSGKALTAIAAALATCVGGGHAQPERAQVRVRLPAPGAVFGWGADAPLLRFEATLERNGGPARGPRVFLTGNVREGERRVDGVLLYDDGTHGDERAGDGVFTGTYRPQRPGSYSLQVRAQWEAPGAGSREAWSDRVPFHVEAIPYARIQVPEPGARVGNPTAVQARLLLEGRPYEQRDPTLRAQAWSAPRREGGPPSGPPLSRRGALLTGRVAFDGRGERLVSVAVSVERRGTRLTATPDTVRVEVVRPPIGLLVLGAFLLALYLALPGRRPTPLYRHTLRLRGGSGTPAQEVVIEPDERPLSRTVGPEGCDIRAPGLAACVCAVEAKPGEPRLTFRARDAGDLRVGSERLPSATLEPGQSLQAGGVRIDYLDARCERSLADPRWKPSTVPKLVFLVIGVVALAAGGWHYWSFYR